MIRRTVKIGFLTVAFSIVPAAAHAAVVADWRMDEQAGASVMVDSASLGGTNNGRISAVTTGVPGLVAGYAYKFGGSNAFVEVPDNAALDPGIAAMRVTATVKTVDGPMPDDSYDLVRKGLTTTAGGNWKMEIKRKATDYSIGRLHCVFKGVINGSRVSVRSLASVDIVDGRQHTVSCIKTATSVQAVVDGRAFTKLQQTGAISNDQPVLLGAKIPGDDVLQGVLDQVSIDIG